MNRFKTYQATANSKCSKELPGSQKVAAGPSCVLPRWDEIPVSHIWILLHRICLRPTPLLVKPVKREAREKEQYLQNDADS